MLVAGDTFAARMSPDRLAGSAGNQALVGGEAMYGSSGSDISNLTAPSLAW